jgi:hypothetical protein
MLPPGVTVARPTPDDAARLWSAAREQDRTEFRVSGIADGASYLSSPDGTWLFAFLRGEPICAFDHYIDRHTIGWIVLDGEPVPVNANSIRFGFIASERMPRRLWPLITRMSEAYVSNRMAENPTMRATALVWPGNGVAVRWLRRLGFEDTGIRVAGIGDRLAVVERRRM